MSDEAPSPLEVALAKAAEDPVHRPEFFRLLLESDVFVLGRTPDGGMGTLIAEAGQTLDIENWQKSDGSPVLPFFTSLDALREAIDEERSCVGLPARSLFEMTRGSVLVMNPASSYGKEFFPEEVEALLATGLNLEPARRVVQKDTRVVVGQPAEYPVEMVSALSALLVRHPSVEAAYLCQVDDPSVRDSRSLLVGLKVDADLDRVVREVGLVAADTAPQGVAVDIVEVTSEGKGFSDYFSRSVEPFYRRDRLTQLKSWLRRRPK